MTAEALLNIHDPTPEDIQAEESFIIDNSEDYIAPQLRTSGGTTDPVRDYLKSLEGVALLTAEQEVDLSKRIEAGLMAGKLLAEGSWQGKALNKRAIEEFEWLASDGEAAREHMIKANLRLVVSIAKKKVGFGLDFLELIQEGNIGLMRGVEKFDYQKGYKFSTYGTWWIRQAITRGLADKARVIRLPVHMVEEVNKVTKVRRYLSRDLGREPEPEEIAKEVGMTLEKIAEIDKYSARTISLEGKIGDDGDMELNDLMSDDLEPSPDDVASFQSMREAMQRIVDRLPEQEGMVISMRYGLINGREMTLRQIGTVYGVSPERIRQIEAHAMSTLRHPMYSSGLEDYLKES